MIESLGKWLLRKYIRLAFANVAKVNIRRWKHEVENNDYGRKQTDQTHRVWIYIHRK